MGELHCPDSALKQGANSVFNSLIFPIWVPDYDLMCIKTLDSMVSDEA